MQQSKEKLQFKSFEKARKMALEKTTNQPKNIHVDEKLQQSK